MITAGGCGSGKREGGMTLAQIPSRDSEGKYVPQHQSNDALEANATLSVTGPIPLGSQSDNKFLAEE